MKTLLVITLFVLVLKSGYCKDTVESLDEAPSDSVPETDSTFQDIDDESQDATSETQNALNEKDLKTQGINLKFKHGSIIIKLTPDGGAYYGNGAVFTRWGKRTCPRGAKTLYSGLAAGGWYNQKGNGANYLCMPPDPQYMSTTSPTAPSLLYGAEYESYNRIFSGTTHDHNVPCAVCQSPRINKVMIPAKVSCPSGWTREYYGYLMTSHVNHYQTLVYECVDHVPDKVPGSAANRNGALFYFVNQNECSYGLPCGPYVARRAVTCAVCTK